MELEPLAISSNLFAVCRAAYWKDGALAIGFGLSAMALPDDSVSSEFSISAIFVGAGADTVLYMYG